MAIVLADNPINAPADDRFDRNGSARAFASDVLAQDAREGLVVGVLGPWGSGKTSFINLARPELERGSTSILDFNPWMFSGSDQLVANFFVELTAQLKLRPGLGDIATSLEEYGEAVSGLAWLPFIGIWLERGRSTAKLARRILERRERRGPRKAQLEEKLRRLLQPVVVVIDDIDRLTTPEIRDVFKLVRLTASFPNVIYVVAFDRRRVEIALTEEGLVGRDYLEKILQVGYDLPAVPKHLLRRELLTALQETLGSLGEIGDVNQETWPDIYMELIDPLIHNMRDVRRYVASVRGTVAALEGEIDLGDVLAVEAMRVFLPDVFARLPESIAALTTTSRSWGRGDDEEAKSAVEALLASAASEREVVVALVTRLFPAAQRHLPHGMHYGSDWTKSWLREHRIAHESFLRLYLERVAGAELVAFRAAEKARLMLHDREALDQHLRGLDPDELESVIGALETYESDFEPEHVVPASIVLLNLLSEIPDRPRGMFDLDARFVVGRVVYRLIRSLREPGTVKAAVDEILPHLTSLSSAFELVTDVGYRENAGHKLVSEDDAASLEREWRNQVRAASVAQLVAEWDLLRILLIAAKERGEGEEALTVPRDPAVTLALLRSARTEVRGQSMGSRAVRRSFRLYWDGLVELYGDEATLVAELAALKTSNVEIEPELLALAEKYAAGWRPKDFASDDDDAD